MGCLSENEVVELAEGRGDDAARASALAHLDSCDGCRVLLAHTMRAVMPTADERAAASRVAPADGIPRVGDVVARYRILERLGAGAMGVVLAAEHLDLRRSVALKIVRPGSGVADEQLRLRLVREARAASAIVHRHVVNVHDVFTLEDGTPVMVMDLLRGESLRERLVRKGRLGVGETLGLVRQVLEALEAAHALGIVHRDLKPDNIFLAREDDGREVVKIVDFGIAKLTALEGPLAATVGLTETGMLIGTPHYMAPEQAFGDGPIDARADLWAVGVIVYECVAGARPIEGSTAGQVLRRLAQLSFKPLEEVAPSVPTALASIVRSLLSEREHRPSSAAEVGALFATIEERPDPQVITDATGVVPTVGTRWLARARRPSPWFLGIGVLALLLGVLLLLDASSSVALRHPGTVRTPHAEETLAASPRAPTTLPIAAANASADASAPPTAASPAPRVPPRVRAPAPPRPAPAPKVAAAPSPAPSPAPEPGGLLVGNPY